MAEIKEFVVNDRRKFTAEGDIRPDAPPSEPKPPRPELLHRAEENDSARPVEQHGPQAVPSQPFPSRVVASRETPTAPELAAAGAQGVAGTQEAADANEIDEQLPPPPTEEQTQQAKRAFDATVDRLDTAIRATNPGMERMPEMTFERVIQSLYMQALMQLGGAAAPGQKPQVDLLGARQTIDMLAILSTKTRGNLSGAESTLLETALFELHMGFLEVTQALQRQAAGRQPGASGAPLAGGPGIVR